VVVIALQLVVSPYVLYARLRSRHCQPLNVENNAMVRVTTSLCVRSVLLVWRRLLPHKTHKDHPGLDDLVRQRSL